MKPPDALGVGLSLSIGLAGAESLWERIFAGLIAGGSVVRVSDPVTIVIDSAASLDFEATAIGNETLPLSLSEPDLGDPVSFLSSDGASDDLSTRGERSCAVQASVGACVIDTDGGSNARVEGTRSLILSRRPESITVAGWLDPSALASGGGRRVTLSQLTDGFLFVASFQSPDVSMLSVDKLVNPEAPVVAGTANPLLAAAAEPDVDRLLAAAGQGDGATGDGSDTGQPKLARNEEQQRELLPQHLNQLVDLMFQ